MKATLKKLALWMVIVAGVLAIGGVTGCDKKSKEPAAAATAAGEEHDHSASDKPKDHPAH